MNTITVGGPNTIGHRFEGWVAFEMKPGAITNFDIPVGFWYHLHSNGMIVVQPCWWRRVIHKLTGRWAVPFLE